MAAKTPEDITVQDNPVTSAASELKAAARDMLRMGSQWAHATREWLDDRRNEMNNSTRDQRDRHEAERAQRNRYSASGRNQGEYRSSGRDRDMQDEYSTRGQFAQRGYQGSTSSQFSASDRDDIERDYGPEGRYPQYRASAPDDYSRRYQSGNMSRQGNEQGTSGMYGTRSARTRESADQDEQGYGTSSYDDRYRYQERSPGMRGAGAQGYGGSRGYESNYRDEQDRASYHGREGYGEREYHEQDYGMQGTTGNQARASGLAGQGYGEQGYGSSRMGGIQGSQYQQSAGYGSGMGFRGVGPRNYSRSDERIREDLNERLTDADDIDASDLSVEVSNGVATLSGRVEQRWMKHRAEDIAESCGGVRDVNNQIRVGSQSGYSDTASGYGSSTGAGSGANASRSGSMGSSSAGRGSSSTGAGSSMGASGTSSTDTSTGTNTGSASTRSTNITGGSSQGTSG